MGIRSVGGASRFLPPFLFVVLLLSCTAASYKLESPPHVSDNLQRNAQDVHNLTFLPLVSNRTNPTTLEPLSPHNSMSSKVETTGASTFPAISTPPTAVLYRLYYIPQQPASTSAIGWMHMLGLDSQTEFVAVSPSDLKPLTTFANKCKRTGLKGGRSSAVAVENIKKQEGVGEDRENTYAVSYTNQRVYRAPAHLGDQYGKLRRSVSASTRTFKTLSIPVFEDYPILEVLGNTSSAGPSTFYVGFPLFLQKFVPQFVNNPNLFLQSLDLFLLPPKDDPLPSPAPANPIDVLSFPDGSTLARLTSNTVPPISPDLITRCPFCQKVVSLLFNNPILSNSIHFRYIAPPTPSPTPSYFESTLEANLRYLISVGGQRQVPALRHSANVLYESSQIIAFLSELMMLINPGPPGGVRGKGIEVSGGFFPGTDIVEETHEVNNGHYNDLNNQEQPVFQAFPESDLVAIRKQPVSSHGAHCLHPDSPDVDNDEINGREASIASSLAPSFSDATALVDLKDIWTTRFLMETEDIRGVNSSPDAQAPQFYLFCQMDGADSLPILEWFRTRPQYLRHTKLLFVNRNAKAAQQFRRIISRITTADPNDLLPVLVSVVSRETPTKVVVQIAAIGSEMAKMYILRHALRTSIRKGATGLRVYSANWCPGCEVLKGRLREFGLEGQVEMLDVDESEKAAREFQRLGGSGIPALAVGENMEYLGAEPIIRFVHYCTMPEE